MAILLMGDTRQRAFDLVVEITKQVITLATALVALGVTFAKDFVGVGPEDARLWLARSWVAFLLSIVFGLVTLMACAGAHGRAKEDGNVDPYQTNIRVVGSVQLLAFVVGLAMSVMAGYLSI